MWSVPRQSYCRPSKAAAPAVMPARNAVARMGSWVAVMGHPFFDVTGKDGKFEIKNVPAGKYTLEVWQEKLGVQTAEVTVGKDDSQAVDFTLKKAPKAKKVKKEK